MLLYGLQGLVRRPSGPKPVGAILKVCFKDWFQYQQHRRLHHPVSHRRYAQRSQFAVWLEDMHPPHCLCAVGAFLQTSLQFLQKSRFALWTGCDLLDAHSVNSRRTLVAPHSFPCGSQCVRSADVSIYTVEAKSLLLFGFLTKLLSQLPEFPRQGRFPNG